MSPLMALWMAVLTALTSVKGVSVAPVGDRTEVVIAVDGQVSVKDFTLDNPARLVLDIEGARYALPRERFIGIERGGIRSLRASQFRATTVRVVFDLQQPVKYTVHREEGLIRVSFPNPAGAFEPWHAGTVVVAGQPNGDARVAQSAERVAAPTTAAPAAAPATQPATAALATQSAATAPTTQLVATGPATGSAATAPATRTMATAPATQSVASTPATQAVASGPAAPPAAAAREPYAAAGGAHVRSAAQQSQEPRITVHFQNSPIVDV
ncbi:MAG TPA: AMIN domain-containing protein, partial [Longimicrobiales bacterium]